MTDSFIKLTNLFADYITEICAAAAIITAILFFIARHFNTEKHFGELVGLAMLGGSIPIGILFVLSPFQPDLINKLRESPPVLLCVLGVIYIGYVCAYLKKKLKK